MKDEFVATVSHELRTPLTSIAGALGLLIGSAAAGHCRAGHSVCWRSRKRNSQRLVRLVNSILDMEKIESGQVVFVLQAVEASALVEQAIEANRGFAEATGVRVRLDAASASGDVHADPDRLVQVVTNLLSNAIKFSPPGEEVMVAIEQRGQTGPHLACATTVREFRPIFKPHIVRQIRAGRRHRRAPIKGGTGLGLSIVKQIVTRLGGEVGFSDAPGGGTIFHVDLPAMGPVAAVAEGANNARAGAA